MGVQGLVFSVYFFLKNYCIYDQEKRTTGEEDTLWKKKTKPHFIVTQVVPSSVHGNMNVEWL